MSSSRRWWLWIPLLGIAAWLALFGDRAATGNAAATSVALPPAATTSPAEPTLHRVAPQPKTGPAAEPIDALIPRSGLVPSAPTATRPATVASLDLFSPRSWTPPPPAASASVAIPVAPPLPFVYLGMKVEGDVWEVYLSRAEQTFIARVGQTLDGSYRVDSITPPSLVLTYLPLGQSQTLPIGDSR
jgi:hypothetical protein